MSDFGRVRVVFFSNPVFERLTAELNVDGDEFADIVWQDGGWSLRFFARQTKVTVPALRRALDQLASTPSP
jgi:hypothetical protein